MKTIFIVFSTLHIGGAEKRFTGLWKSFQHYTETNLQVILILNPSLYNELLASGDISKEDKNVVVATLSEKNFGRYRTNVKKILKSVTKKGDIVHFIGLSPIIKIRGVKQLLSITGTKLNVDGYINMLLILMSAFYVNAIDVLDPLVYKKIKNIFFWKRKKIHQTTNSFCDINLFTPVPFSQKQDWIVFLGRFDAVKQVVQIAEAIPFVFESLQRMHKRAYHFFLLGHGALEPQIRAVLSKPEFRNIPITVEYNKQPSEILNKSKFFLSLQLYNNYPSRSLLEAMAAGNIPIVTDNGQTRWIAKPEFAYYVPENFNKEELATALLQAFSLSPNEWANKATAARKLVVEEHDIKNMQSYFKTLYLQL